MGWLEKGEGMKKFESLSIFNWVNKKSFLLHDKEERCSPAK